MTSQYRCYHVDDKIIKQCKYCPNSRGGSWYVSFCIGIKNHHPIKREELEIIPDWCPLPVHSDFQSEQEINCPICGAQVMRHYWCIDSDCGWDSLKEEQELRKGGEQG